MYTFHPDILCIPLQFKHSTLYVYHHSFNSALEAPFNVTAVTTSSSNIVVSWSPPEIPNGVILSYIVQYSPVGDSSNISEVAAPPSASRMRAVLSFLRPSTNYSITVSVIYSAGSRIPSRSLIARTYDSRMYTV